MGRIKRKYIVSLFITICGFFALISGTSYAILKGQTTSTNEQVIKAGSVELILTEEYNVMDKGIAALDDPDGLLQEEVYEFNIRNTGTVTAKYDVKLVDDGTNDITDSFIKVGLEVNGKEMGPMRLSSVQNIIDSNIINKNEVIRYKLRLWVDKTEDNTYTEASKASFKISVDAKQSEYKPTVLYRWSNQNVQKGDALSTVTGSTIDYTTLNKTFFIEHSLDKNNKIASSEVCYVLNTEMYCLKGFEGDGNTDSPYYKTNIAELQKSFGKNKCVESATMYTCENAGLVAEAGKDGNVRVSDNTNNCFVNAYGVSSCNEE